MLELYLPVTSVLFGDGTFSQSLLLLAPLLAVVAYPAVARLLLPLAELTPLQQRSLLRSIPSLSNTICQRLRVWNSGQRICNAAAIGCVPGFSYVVVSDGMLSNLKPRETAAIIAHELGHLRLWHIPIRLCVVLAGGLLGLALIHNAESLGNWQAAAQVSSVLATMGYMWVMLYLVAPILEYQADGYAVDAMAGQEGNRQRAARALIRALAKLSELSGAQPNSRTWLHPSFEDRRLAILAQQSSSSVKYWLRTVLAMLVMCQLALIGICLAMIMA